MGTALVIIGGYVSFLCVALFLINEFLMGENTRLGMSHMSVAVNMTARPGGRTFFLPGLFYL